MKKLIICCGIVALLSCGALWAQKAGASRNEREIKRVLDAWAKAFSARDVDGIMETYAPDVFAYDIVPPLQFTGAEAYRKDYEKFLAMYTGSISVEFRELHIEAGSTVGYAAALERISGTLKSGEKSDLWLRATSVFRKTDGKWLDVHDHVSVPTDFDTGKSRLDLQP